MKWNTSDEQVKEQMDKWAVNVNSEIMMDEWEYLWKISIRISTCTAIQKNSYKLIYRWYMTPKKLAKIYKKSSSNCWKCGRKEGSLFHMWWSCTKAKKYWSAIYCKMRKIMRIKFPKRPELFLLGIDLRQIRRQDRTLIWYMIVAARVVYASYWKQPSPPKVSE